MRRAMAVASAAALICGLGACAGRSASGPPAPKAVASIQDIMDAQVDPAADVLWDSVQVVSDAKGVTHFQPRTDADWASVRKAALVLVEAPNLLAMPGRQVAASGRALADADAPGMLTREQIQANLDRRHDEFAGFAVALQAVGLEALQATDRRDVAALNTAGGKIDGVCEECHLQFWYPKAEQAK